MARSSLNISNTLDFFRYRNVQATPLSAKMIGTDPANNKTKIPVSAQGFESSRSCQYLGNKKASGAIRRLFL